jgi:glycosyltransferase involved in cell wall biosynthesis
MLTASLSRQAGGLFVSVRMLAKALQTAGCQVQVFGAEDEYTRRDKPQWGEVPVVTFSPKGPTAFCYMPKLNTMLQNTSCDVLHTHAIWMYPSLAATRWATRQQRPHLVSPSGMLDSWALQNSGWKKHIAGWLYENAHLRNATCLHALCQSEFNAIRAYGLRNPVCVIPNGVELPLFHQNPTDPVWVKHLPKHARVMFFLGRLHPKKGLRNLLQAWAELEHHENRIAESWYLVIAGWDQGGHLHELQQCADDLSITSHVRFVGPQFGAEKDASFARADAFILPSFSEGLPIAVLEAWSHKLPVLMTSQCNLPEGFAAEAALALGSNVKSITAGLAEFFALNRQTQTAMGERGWQLVKRRFSWQHVAEEMLAVYRWVLGHGERPDCVILN